MAGHDGVGGRIDVFATALSVGMTVQQIEGLDLAYAPPFAPVYDPISIAATVARKALKDSTTGKSEKSAKKEKSGDGERDG
jgi:hypothetical protein